MAELFDILGKGGLQIRGDTVPTMVLDDLAFIKFNAFTAAIAERGNVAPDLNNHRVSVTEDGEYLIDIGFNFHCPAPEELEIKIYINGTDRHTPSMTAEGMGAGKGVNITWVSSAHLIAGDYVECFVKNGRTGSNVFHFELARLVLRADS